jgi:hypothetical protein
MIRTSLVMAGFLLLFSAGAWAQNATLRADPKDGPFDGFSGIGNAVAVQGRTAMLGAPYIAPPNTTGTYPYTFPYYGVVNIYTATRDRTAWNLTDILHAEDGDNPDWYFGSTLALDGKRLAVGASQTVRLYEKLQGHYALSDKISLDYGVRGTLIYQAGVLIFNQQTPTGVEIAIYDVNKNGRAKYVTTLVGPEGANQFGFTGGLSYDAQTQTLAAGVVNTADTVPGQVWFYEKHGTQWRLEQRQTLSHSSSVNSVGSYFGAAVSLRGDKLLVGAPLDNYYYDNTFNFTFHAGAVYVYARKGNNWLLTQKIATDDPASPVNNLVDFGDGLANNGHYVYIQSPANGDGHSTTVQQGPASLWKWHGDQLELYQLNVNVSTPGGLAMSRRYVVDGSGDYIYGNSATIIDLKLLEGNNSASTTDDEADAQDE